MPDYFCGTCNKTLARNEQRRNYETTTTSGPIIVTQLNLPNQVPLAVGRALNRTHSHLVVQCLHCGSDAVEMLTDEEKASLAAKCSEERIAVTVVVIAIVLFCVLLIWAAMKMAG
jgi:hypothetical protein